MLTRSQGCSRNSIDGDVLHKKHWKTRSDLYGRYMLYSNKRFKHMCHNSLIKDCSRSSLLQSCEATGDRTEILTRLMWIRGCKCMWMYVRGCKCMWMYVRGYLHWIHESYSGCINCAPDKGLWQDGALVHWCTGALVHWWVVHWWVVHDAESMWTVLDSVSGHLIVRCE